MKTKAQVTCFGEILWDVFPTHKVIGGAPLNVALRLQSFGVDTAIISRIGNEENGKKALEYLKKNRLPLDFIQNDNDHETGHVIVTLDEKGSASYEIFNPVAWDYIQATEANVKLVANSEVFLFGSLACREKVSRETLFQLLEYANFKVFDVNLRPPDFTIELLLKLMEKSDMIKMNDEELEVICKSLNANASSIEEQIQFVSNKTNTYTICITKGGEGAILWVDNSFYYNKGFKVKVEDTVGAGDSFLAGLITKLLIEKIAPQSAIDFACAVGSLVASKKGANANIEDSEINKFLA